MPTCALRRPQSRVSIPDAAVAVQAPHSGVRFFSIYLICLAWHPTHLNPLRRRCTYWWVCGWRSFVTSWRFLTSSGWRSGPYSSVRWTTALFSWRTDTWTSCCCAPSMSSLWWGFYIYFFCFCQWKLSLVSKAILEVAAPKVTVTTFICAAYSDHGSYSNSIPNNSAAATGVFPFAR